MTFFGLLGTAIVGLIVGAIAGWLSPGREPRGCLATMLIGVAGAFVARWIGNAAFGWYSDGSAPGWIMSILGAALLLWLWRVIQGRRN